MDLEPAERRVADGADLVVRLSPGLDEFSRYLFGLGDPSGIVIGQVNEENEFPCGLLHGGRLSSRPWGLPRDRLVRFLAEPVKDKSFLFPWRGNSRSGR